MQEVQKMQHQNMEIIQAKDKAIKQAQNMHQELIQMKDEHQELNQTVQK